MYNKRFISARTPVLSCMALFMVLLISAGTSQLAHAASGDGSLVGHLNAADKNAVSGAEITARNVATGFTRKVKADADGSYRFPFLPVGTYTVEASKDGKSLGSLEGVPVSLGVATTGGPRPRRHDARNRDRRGITGTELRRRHLHRERDQRYGGRAGAPARGARPDVRGATRAGLEQGRFRLRRRLVRRVVGCRELGLHQWTQRHGLLQPHRVLVGAVRVLQGVPGQDRRLLGRVRAHHRRRDQRRDHVRHQRIRIRGGNGVGAELRAGQRRKLLLAGQHRCRHASAAVPDPTSTTNTIA